MCAFVWLRVLLLNVVACFVCEVLRDVLGVVVVLMCMCLCMIWFEQLFACVACDLLCGGVWLVISVFVVIVCLMFNVLV